MTSALEELQEEVVGELRTLTKDKLLEICDFLYISGEQRRDVQNKSRISLMTHIMMFLEREEVAELEDGGMSELLLLKDEMTEMISGIDNKTGQTDYDIEPAGTHHRIEELRTITPQHKPVILCVSPNPMPIFRGACRSHQMHSPAHTCVKSLKFLVR